jgi:hypothetical protein
LSPGIIELRKKLLKTGEFSELRVEPPKKRKKPAEEKCLVDDAKTILQNEAEMAQKYVEKMSSGLDSALLMEVFELIRNRKDNAEDV